MHPLAPPLLLTLLGTPLLLGACQDSFADCESNGTCGPEGTAGGEGGATPGDGDGDGDTGGTGGSTPGDGDGDTVGTGGTTSPCDACTGETPACNAAEECVECTAADTSACDGTNTPVCVEETCLECGDNADCTDPSASLCQAGTCTACTSNDDCTHLAGTLACDADGGACVECTDSSDCGGKPCNPISHTCSAFGTDSQDTCEACDSDDNCGVPDNFCVPMQYQGTDRSTGYCLKKTPDCEKPFGTLLTGRESLSGVVSQNYCGINEALATCEAVRALLDDVECAGSLDSECPESGLCRDIGGTFSNRCTYECSGASDCKQSGPGSTCGTTPDNYCGFVL